MPLNNLSAEEKTVVLECLKCVAAGRVLAHDWEFQTLMGIEPGELQAVVNAWPQVDDSEEKVACAIGNSMNSLLGLLDDEALRNRLPVLRSQVVAVFKKWRGEQSGY
jgi:hypothetical protein